MLGLDNRPSSILPSAVILLPLLTWFEGAEARSWETDENLPTVKTLRTDQVEGNTFPEFLAASRRAGIVRYDVDSWLTWFPSYFLLPSLLLNTRAHQDLKQRGQHKLVPSAPTMPAS